MQGFECDAQTVHKETLKDTHDCAGVTPSKHSSKATKSRNISHTGQSTPFGLLSQAATLPTPKSCRCQSQLYKLVVLFLSEVDTFLSE